MQISQFSRQNRPTDSEWRVVLAGLRKDLIAYCGQELVAFREHISKDRDAANCWVASDSRISNLFAFQWEGVILCTLTKAMPRVSAELLLFSHGKRVGCCTHNGSSYLHLTYALDPSSACRWQVGGWQIDGPEDWDNITAPRVNEYLRPLE